MARSGRIELGAAVIAAALVAAAAPIARGATGPSPRWSAPVRFLERGVVSNGWLDDSGTFRTVGVAGGRATLRTVTRDGSRTGPAGSDGAVAAIGLRGARTLAVDGTAHVRLTVLRRDGRIGRVVRMPGRLPELLGFTIPAAVGIPGGGALVCTDLARGAGEALARVSADGSAVHIARVRAIPGAPATESPSGGCFGIAVAPGARRAAVIDENADATEGSGAASAQVLVQRVDDGAAPRPPVPVVPAGERFTVNEGEPRVAETRAGWVVVTWLSSVHRGNRLRTHQNVRWISPRGRLGPVRTLTAPAPGIPPAVTLAPTGARSASALVNPEDRDRTIESVALTPGGVGARRTLFRGQRIVPPTVAAAAHAAVAAWTAASGVFASRWRSGRWTAPALVRPCTIRLCPANPGVAVSPSGRAAVWFSLQLPGMLPQRFGGAVSFAAAR